MNEQALIDKDGFTISFGLEHGIEMMEIIVSELQSRRKQMMKRLDHAVIKITDIGMSENISCRCYDGL